MNIGDKLTWSYRSLFILMLIWLRFIDEYITAYAIWVVWAVIVFLIFYQPVKRIRERRRQAQQQELAEG
jgi:hypothetical protein